MYIYICLHSVQKLTATKLTGGTTGHNAKPVKPSKPF